MNLVNGKIITEQECQAAVDNLEAELSKTLKEEKIHYQDVIRACDSFSKSLNFEEYTDILISYGISNDYAKKYFEEVKLMLSKEYLTHKLFTELGENGFEEKAYTPPFSNVAVKEKLMPLGVLFHIAAGNSDGLPVFTLIEGLLTGNINILKLPKEEGGLTVRFLQELFKIEPRLAKFVYVFDYSSKDLENMKKMADMADAIVVWGSDQAVSSVRDMAKPSTKIIEWGHKLSFAYVTKSGLSDEHLYEIAENICSTNQLLCSSCQGIFFDTQSMEELYELGERFLSILDKTIQKYDSGADVGIQAQIGLKVYNEELISVDGGSKVFKTRNCSVIAYEDSRLTDAIKFGNIWIKRLPRGKILDMLRKHKGYLQTVALIASAVERDEIAELFLQCGSDRITDGSQMSNMYCGSHHDGQYAMRRYTKMVYITG